MHTVVAWDFAMAIAPMWHSTIFGPYFVAGAIFSGIAALVLVMAVLRQVLHLEDYLTRHHFDNLAKLLLLMSLLWLYFTAGGEPDGLVRQRAEGNGRLQRPHARALTRRTSGRWWSCNFVVPFVLLGIRRLRTITHRHHRGGVRC